jgi:hypothetical protein
MLSLTFLRFLWKRARRRAELCALCASQKKALFEFVLSKRTSLVTPKSKKEKNER